MSSVRCPRCKCMYEFTGMPPSYCPECTVTEEAEYFRVREYVREHPGIKADVVSKDLGVPHEKVMQYLKEERLEIAKTSKWFMKCEICGRPVTTGTKCPECKKRCGS